jgi:hypothetical protein
MIMYDEELNVKKKKKKIIVFRETVGFRNKLLNFKNNFVISRIRTK